MNVLHSGFSRSTPQPHQANEIFEWTERPGENLITDAEWTAIKAQSRLSMREGQVCRLLFEGKKRDEIAELLGISPRTVRYHLESLHKKLQVNTRVGLVLRMVQLQAFIKRKKSYSAPAPNRQYAAPPRQFAR